ncbi:MAG TPA: hypothetical protein IAB52_01020 [Candidatus Scatomonas merdavium]|nr:hypothetical protein [Candidatus Scatomonas merdavium]
MTLYEERLKRTMDAVHMESVDKIPFSYNGPAYLARAEGLKIADYITDFDRATDAAVHFACSHPGIDSLHTPIISPYVLCDQWLSAVRVPGVELPPDELWQMDEKENMHREDYEKIIKAGYEVWLKEFMVKRLDDPRKKALPFFQHMPQTVQRLASEAQVPVINQGNFCSPFEGFCGARGLMNFFVDLCEEPELVRAALDKAMDYTYQAAVAQMETMHPFGAWIGVWRGAPQFLSHDTWMEFVWPDTLKLIKACVDHDVLPILHFDSCWDTELESLKDLPEKKCILMFDGTTDMRQARKILEDQVCLMGDVPSRMTANDSPEAVYRYVIDLIRDVGPETGLIVSTGCDAPLNAKPENIDAIIQATVDYKK